MESYSESRYQQAVADLYERHQSVQSAGFTGDAYKPGLASMERFDAMLGHPWRKYRTLHVAGTNGKGSVSSMLAAALSSSGLRTGLYTSPHITDFRERMKLVCDGGYRMIPKEDVLLFLDTYASAMDGLSFFEITTGMALWWFAREGADAAVIEVGLGGRLDSTNIITPEVSVVVSIGLDHCAILGDTRAAIAAEKAGIFKRGVPAVAGIRDDETEKVFAGIAAGVAAPLTFASDNPVPDGFNLDLEGDCQPLNLRTACAALDAAGFDWRTPSVRAAISNAAAITGFHGRWERVLDIPETICDIGHNPAALKYNFSKLSRSGRPLVIVYGVMADKDLDCIAPLMPANARYVLSAPHTARSLPVDTLQRRLSGLRPDLDTMTATSVAEAVRMALAEAEAHDNPMVYIGGSTFVVSEAMDALASFKRQP